MAVLLVVVDQEVKAGFPEKRLNVERNRVLVVRGAKVEIHVLLEMRQFVLLLMALLQLNRIV